MVANKINPYEFKPFGSLYLFFTLSINTCFFFLFSYRQSEMKMHTYNLIKKDNHGYYSC